MILKHTIKFHTTVGTGKINNNWETFAQLVSSFVTTDYNFLITDYNFLTTDYNIKTMLF